MIAIDMDMPMECHECRFQLKFKDGEADDYYNRRCVIEGRTIVYPRPDWCPLRQAMTLKAVMIPPDYPDPAICRQVVRNEVAKSIMRRLEDDGIILFEEGIEPHGRNMIIGKLDVVFPEGMTVEQARRLIGGGNVT